MPSIQQLNKKADRSFAEQLNEECKAFCRNNNGNTNDILTQTKNDIKKLQTITNSLSERMTVVLRFVDWYSNVQLNQT